MKLPWLALSLVLLVCLVATSSAFAEAETTAAIPPPGVDLSEEGETEEECSESSGEDEEEAGDAEEECESEAEESGGSSSADDCLLRTANARVVALPAHNTLRLTLGYTTFEPARATVEYGARKDDRLGTASRTLGRSGVVRLSKHLGDGELARLRGAHHLTVTVNVPGVPQRCLQQVETQQLAVRQSSSSRITWSESR